MCYNLYGQLINKMRLNKLNIFILLILLMLIHFSFNVENNKSSIYLNLSQIISGNISIYDILAYNQKTVFNLIKYERNKYENNKFYETINYDNNKKVFILENFQDEFYSKSIFNENLNIIYKETIDKKNSLVEKLILKDGFYLFQKYSNHKLKDEKKLKIFSDDIVLVDVLPYAIKIFIANKKYEKYDSIKFTLGFLQNSQKINLNMSFKIIYSIQDLIEEYEINYMDLMNYSINPSVLVEIDAPEFFKIWKMKIIYVFSIDKPFYQYFLFFGNSKNYFIVLLKSINK